MALANIFTHHITQRKIFEIVFRILFLPFFWLIYFVSSIYPRNPRIWIFGDYKGRFSDNSKYLYLDVVRKKGDIKAIWISPNKKLVNLLKSRGLNAYYKWSIRGIRYTLQAGVWFFTFSSKDINFWLSGGNLIKINLWHGIPLKKIEHDAKKGVVYLRRRLENNLLLQICFQLAFPWHYESKIHQNYYALATSPLTAKLFSSAFQIPFRRIIISNYPRCKALFKKIPNEDIGIDMRAKRILIDAKRKNKKIIFYAPTFRDDGTDSNILDVVNWKDFDNFLKKHNAILFVKPHLSSSLRSLPSFENIILVDSCSDAYPLLRHVDVLITDYSSIYFDFLLLDRPIIFFCYDLEKYINKNRELYFNYGNFTPGQKARTYPELKRAIIVALNNKDLFANERNRVRKLVFDYQKDLMKYIHEIVNKTLN